jgi:RimJ/RimL family protein N-acetyltransferase
MPSTGLEPVEITAGRLYLRPWEPHDVQAVYAALQDLDVRQWSPGAASITDLEGARAWIEQRNREWEWGVRAAFAVLDATSGAVLGSVAIRDIDPLLGFGTIGYWVLPEARGHGVATQALDTISRWAFASLGLHRLELRHAIENRPSCRVAEKAGYRLEGLLRESFRRDVDEPFHNEHLHAQLATDPGPHA